MEEYVKDYEQPFQIFAVLDGKECLHTGYPDKNTAELNLPTINKRAEDLKLKTKYIIKEIKK